VEAVRKPVEKINFGALWTEICLAMPAIQAQGEGYDVYVVTDASGGVSVEAHDMAVRRMVQAGIVPMTWLAVASEWQRDWAAKQAHRHSARCWASTGAAPGRRRLEAQLLGAKR